MENMLDMRQTAVRLIDSHQICWQFVLLNRECIEYIHSLECIFIYDNAFFFKFLTVADLCHKFTQNLVEKKQVIYNYLFINEYDTYAKIQVCTLI